jgi:hypothetical protein
MVDAFPLPRHRDKLSRVRSRFSGTGTRRFHIRKSCVEITRAILADIQRGAQQLQMSMDAYNGSRRFTFSGARDVLTYQKLTRM